MSRLFIMFAPLVAYYALWGVKALCSDDPCRRDEGLWGVLVGLFYFGLIAQGSFG